jgi:hypothetical protein
LPATTPAGQALSQAKRKPRILDSWEDVTFWERCLTKGGFPNIMFPRGYNNNTQIVQAPGYVAFLHEMIHEVRIVPLDGRAHLPQNVTQWMGNPRGHWEGDTLVIETTNIDPRVTALQPWANFTSHHENYQRTLRTVERVRRIATNMLDYRITVEEPEMYTRPWTVELPMVVSREPVFEYACHESNYFMTGALAGARAQEAAEAKGGTPPERVPATPVGPPE